MSFLSRRPSRSGSREGDAGREDEYDDYDYAPDGYRGDEDENWSPGEYFSPEGIKGRWADGQRPGERPAARGRRGDPGRGDSGRGDSAQGYDDRAGAGYDDDGYNGYGPGGYGADEYATGAYDLPEGADEERAERGGRRRKERGERGARLRLGRRDRGEDIWPDDGVSDEDYWASVASDRPLTGGNPPPEADLPPAADGRPMGRTGGRGNSNHDVHAADGSRPGADPRSVGDQRYGDDQRGVTGRLGPPPGLAGDYQPGGGANSGRAASGPMAGFTPSGGARPGTGPMAVRPGTGPISAWSSQAGYAQSGTGPRPSFQPGGGPAASRPAAGRPSDRGDWGERTERIERVNAAGYPEPRGNGRGQVPGRPATAAATSGPFGVAGGPGAPGRGRVDVGRADNGRIDSADWRTSDRREQGRNLDREPSRGTGGWPATGRGGLPADRTGDRPGADDPLTSTAYSRASASDSDGRSYRVAARRSQAQAKLTEQTQVFSAPTYSSDQHRTGPYDSGLTGEYPARQYDAGTPGTARGGQYQTGATGEYPTGQHRTPGVTGVTGKSAADQYRSGDYRTGEYRTGEYRTGEYAQHPADAQASASRHPGYSSSQSGPSGLPNSAVGSGQSVHPVQPNRRGQQAPAGPSGSSTPSGANGSGAVGWQLGPGQPAERRRRALRPVPDAAAAAPAAAPAAPVAAVPATAVPATAPARPAATPGDRAVRPGTDRPGPARPTAQQAGPCRRPRGAIPTSPRLPAPIPIPSSLSRPVRPRPATGRAERTPPWMAGTAATVATLATTGTTGRDRRRPTATTLATTAMAPPVIGRY